MKENNHIIDQISDYVLNLLPEVEQQKVVRHVAICTLCHQALLRERHLTRTVQQTIHAASRPDGDRLESLRPPSPHVTAFPRQIPVWQRQMAAIGVVILLLLGGISLSAGQRAGGWLNPSPAFYRPVTATQTNTPTRTATATAISGLPAHSTAAPEVVEPTYAPRPAITPEPFPAQPGRLPTN